MEQLLQDLRYALRQFRRSPTFTAIAAGTLALGIGANTAIFSVVQGVLLRPLPFAEADRLVMLYTGYPDDDTRYPLSAPDFMSYHDDARSFAGVAAVTPTELTLTGVEEPEWVRVGLVSADLFDVMGVSPIVGRSFRSEENQPGENHVALLSHAYWTTRFGADPGIVGRTLTLHGLPREVVGVLPPEFDFPNGRQIYYPLAYGETFNSTTAQGRRSESLFVVARLAPGASVDEAAAEVGAINRRLQLEFPETNSENIEISMVPLRDHLTGEVRTPLLVLLAAVGLVLLIACANVANLLLARASARRGELAVRFALGAGRGRVVRQLLTESLLLGLIGGGLGLLLALSSTRALLALAPAGIPRLDTIAVDGAVVAFTGGVAVATGLLFGLLPALQLSLEGPSRMLREARRGVGGSHAGRRVRRVLVVSEMALAVLLLVGAGLLIRSFVLLTSVDPGFRSEGIVTFSVSLPATSYEDGASVRQFYPALLERIGDIAGVEAVAAGSEVPLGGTGNISGFSIENREPPAVGFVMDAAVTAVTPGYFPALGIPLRQGRLLDPRDRFDAPDAVAVNEAFVRRYFPGEETVGRRISFDGESWAEIVGVVGDAPQYGLDRDVRPAVYWPHEQYTTRSLVIVVRAAGDPLRLVEPLRREVAALDPDLPVRSFATGEHLVAESLAQPRFYMSLLAVFAAIALVLAAVGTYGVISYLVTERSSEFGIRIALGAGPGDVLLMVIRQGALLAGAGVGIGLLVAALLTRSLRGMLHGVGALDPVAFVGVALVLLGVALLATYLPARRATRADPVVALRAD